MICPPLPPQIFFFFGIYLLRLNAASQPARPRQTNVGEIGKGLKNTPSPIIASPGPTYVCT